MSRRAVLGILCVVLTVALYYFGQSQPRKPAVKRDAPSASAPAQPTPAQSLTSRPVDASTPAVATEPVTTAAEKPANLPMPVAPANATPPTPAEPETPEAGATKDLEDIQFALRDYRSVFGENPVGTNAEITKALTGNNLKQVKIPLPPGSKVDEDGQLLDRWGTPYFFHQLSGTEMEIRSAGPDKKMWTGDDKQAK